MRFLARFVAPSLVLFVSIVASGCASTDVDTRDRAVLTKQEQDRLTPHAVLERLKAGNRRFVAEDTVERAHSEQVRKAVAGQYPKAIVLSCVDSRVPVEDVFDQGIGDIFVARVAGNFVNADILGSMEFATAVAGSKVVLVMGHEHCGAIKAAIDTGDGTAPGHLDSLVRNLRPAVAGVGSYPGERSSGNADFVHEVCVSNVRGTVDRIRAESEVLRGLEAEGRIKVVGAVYDMDTGVVSFM